MKFLIIDGNKIFRKYLRQFVAKETDQCIELDSGQNVNSIYRNFQPDWVLLDIMLEEPNGFKVAESLKREFPFARFALISDYSDGMFRRKAAKIGAAAFIPKDDLFELTEIIYRR